MFNKILAEPEAIWLGYEEITWKLDAILEVRTKQKSDPKPDSKSNFEPGLEVHLQKTQLNAKIRSRTRAEFKFNPLIESEPEAMFHPVPLTEPELEPEAELDPMPPSGLVTSLSDKSSSF